MMPYIIQRIPCGARNRISIVFACSCGRAKTIQIYGTCGRPFFENGEINPRFQKYPDAGGRGLKVRSAVGSHNFVLI